MGRHDTLINHAHKITRRKLTPKPNAQTKPDAQANSEDTDDASQNTDTEADPNAPADPQAQACKEMVCLVGMLIDGGVAIIQFRR